MPHPTSAFLFDVALDPFLEAMASEFQNNKANTTQPARRGIVRACAEDIGTALLSFKGLMLLKPIFDNASLLVGLVLGPLSSVHRVMNPGIPFIYSG